MCHAKLDACGVVSHTVCCYSLDDYKDCSHDFCMQACTADGTVYDITNIVPYVQKFKKHPVSGEPLQLKDIIQLHFHKNADNEYHDPILHKVRHAQHL